MNRIVDVSGTEYNPTQLYRDLKVILKIAYTTAAVLCIRITTAVTRLCLYICNHVGVYLYMYYIYDIPTYYDNI